MIDPSQLGQFPYPGIFQPGTIPGQIGGLFGAQPALSNGLVLPPSVNSGLFRQTGVALPTIPPAVATTGTNPPPAAPVESPPTVGLPPTDSTDAFAGIRAAGGGFLSAIGNILGASSHFIARPGFELLTEPQAVMQAFGENVVQNQGDPFKFINLLNEKFEENKAPGIVKIAGEMALDPLTYASAGPVKAISELKYVKPVIEATRMEPAVGAAISGLETYEKAVDKAFQSGSALIQGIATNYIPLGVAKENARSVLSNVLPDGLVNTILNAVPEEYRGVPIGAITAPLNKANPKLGLPEVLGFPDVRILKNAAAFNNTFDATRDAISERGINPFAPGPSVDMRRTLRDIAYNPRPDSDADILVSSVLRNPGILTPTDLKRLNTAIGGINTEPTFSHSAIFDSVVNAYHMRDIDEGTAVQAISQILGVGPKTHPEAGQQIVDFLTRRDDATTNLINNLGKLNPDQIIGELSARAKNLSDKRFSAGIELQRQADTYMDQFLNKFDTQYTMLWKNGIQKFITTPLNMMYLGFGGYPIGNAIESMARSIVGGAGISVPTDVTHFNIENGLVPHVPSELFKDESRQAYVVREMVQKGRATPLDVLAQATAAPIVGFGSHLEQNIRRHYWNTALDQELDNVYLGSGIAGNTEFTDWLAAARPPNTSQDPRFTGLSQELANRISNMGIKAVTNGTDAVEALKNAIDAGLYNREKLAGQLADDEAFQQLHPTSRAIMVNWAKTGEASQAAASDMIDRVITNEKKLLEIAPDVLAEKFKGLADQIVARGKTPNFNTADLWQNMTHLRAIKDQFADIPNMMRMAEYNGIAENLLKGVDTAAVHDEFASRIAQSMDAVNKQIGIANTHLLGQAERLGIRPEMEQYLGAVQADHDLLVDTWLRDSEFRRGFFAQKPNRRLDSTWNDPVDGYFPQRAQIWDTFNQQHVANRANIQAAELNFQNAMVGKAQREAAAAAEINRITNENSATQAVIDGVEGGSPIEEIERSVTESTGNAAPDTPEGVINAESEARTSRGPGQFEVVRPKQDGANNLTGNGPSAEPADPGTDFFTSKYAAVDSIRPRLEEILTTAFQNPAMTADQQRLLIAHIDNMNKVFNGLSQDGQKVLNDSLREAAKRARERYDKAYISYDNQTIFDFLAKHIFPFWVYESRRWPYLLQTTLEKPGLAVAYRNYMDQTDQGYIPIGETPFQVNPLRGTILGGINRATGADRPLRFTQGLPGALDSIEQTFGKFGFYFGPHISIPSQVIKGEAGQALPEAISSFINTGRFIGAPGAQEFQNLLPDAYRDYYARQIIASQGLEPDKVYQRALDDPNSFEAKALDAAQRQASMVAVVLGQTGVLRYRTPEYSAYQQQRMEAIERITGISVQQQRNMQQNGISVSQVASLTPAQRQEIAALPGAPGFAEVSEPLLNPAAQKLRERQREFFDAVKTERESVLAEQEADDRRMQQGVISGAEWRKRFQDRNGKVAEMIDNLKKTEAYKNVPISADEQNQARARFNLPPITLSPVDIVLQEYYNVKPQVDGVTGDVDWGTFFDQRQAVLNKYPEVATVVKEQLDKHNTPQVQDFRNAQQLLHPYFGIKDQVLKAFPQLAQVASQAQVLENTNPVQGALFRQNSAELKVLNKLVEQYQQAARMRFPQLDAALVKYYGATPEMVQMMQKGSGLPSNLTSELRPSFTRGMSIAR